MREIQAILDLGVREFVVCAGARNLPMVEALVHCDEVFVWHHFEERSAGFFALGRTMSMAQPCAVVTTSGTAVAELLPAVIEAHYQGRPLIVVSADRPSSYRGSGAPQAIEQKAIFGNYVEFCHDITGETPATLAWSGRLPLHVNICLEEEIEKGGKSLTLGEFKPQRESISVGQAVGFIRDSWDGLLVALGGLEPEDREEVFYLLKNLKVPVIADATSGLREGLGKLLVARPEQLLEEGMLSRVLRIGEVPVGRFWRDLEKRKDIDVLSLSRTGFSGLARDSQVVKGDITRIIKGMGELDSVGDVTDALSTNNGKWAACDELLEAFPDGEPGMLRVLSQYTVVAEQLYLGNSLPIREWNQFAQREHPIEFVRANRGANGIDGQISTWLGSSAGMDDSWAIFGDLTTLYDIAGLGLLGQTGGLRRVMVVINNGGGRIFERLPRVAQMDKEIKDCVVNPHEMDFSHLAAMWGMDYVCFSDALEIDIEPSEKPLFVELRPDEKQTSAFWKRWNTAE